MKVSLSNICSICCQFENTDENCKPCLYIIKEKRYCISFFNLIVEFFEENLKISLSKMGGGEGGRPKLHACE